MNTIRIPQKEQTITHRNGNTGAVVRRQGANHVTVRRPHLVPSQDFLTGKVTEITVWRNETWLLSDIITP